MIPIIWSYNRHSHGAKELAKVLGVKLVHPDTVDFSYKSYHKVVNYGNSNSVLRVESSNSIINSIEAVNNSCSKSATFLRLSRNDLVQSIFIPEWTNDINIARQWSAESAVVARSLLRASSGRGMAITQKGMAVCEVVDGRRVVLWTKYIPKRKEFRVHVFGGTVIDVQQKRKRAGQETADTQIRNLANGWVFTRDDIEKPADLEPMAISAVQALELDFGAVDMIWNEHRNKSYVLEVNTAPGLEGTTLDKYAAAIISACRV